MDHLFRMLYSTVVPALTVDVANVSVSVAVFPAKNLKGSETHFDTKSNIVLGARYAEKYLLFRRGTVWNWLKVEMKLAQNNHLSAKLCAMF